MISVMVQHKLGLHYNSCHGKAYIRSHNTCHGAAHIRIKSGYLSWFRSHQELVIVHGMVQHVL